RPDGKLATRVFRLSKVRSREVGEGRQGFRSARGLIVLCSVILVVIRLPSSLRGSRLRCKALAVNADFGLDHKIGKLVPALDPCELFTFADLWMLELINRHIA